MFAFLRPTHPLQRTAAISAVLSAIAIAALRSSGGIEDATTFVLLTIPLALATLSAILCVAEGRAND